MSEARWLAHPHATIHASMQGRCLCCGTHASQSRHSTEPANSEKEPLKKCKRMKREILEGCRRTSIALAWPEQEERAVHEVLSMTSPCNNYLGF